MTREEFNRKAEAGTLTVGDVLRNREYATAEQLAALTDGPNVDRFRKIGEAIGEGVAQIADDLDAEEQAVQAAAVEQWDTLAEDKTNPDR